MSLPQETLNLITEFEGYLRPLKDGTDRVRPYLCPANVATIGWGTTVWPNGQPVRMSDAPITRERAMEVFSFDMDKYAKGVDALMKGVEWHELMRGACVSFSYNCGVGAFKKSTLRKKVVERDYEDVPREFMKWRMGGGRVLRGLERRRAREAAMFMKGVTLMRSGSYRVERPKQHVPETMRDQIGFWRTLLRWFFGDK